MSDPAEVYEEVFVPALFGQWAELVADVALVAPGQRVLDVACGTGILARTIYERLGGKAAGVVGLDLNEGMLAAAARRNPNIEWRQGTAEALPFADGRFDRVVSQFGLMFFQRPEVAIGEFWRVLAPGGRMVMAVWDSVDSAPGYVAFIDLLARTLGDDAADALRVPFALGDVGRLEGLFHRAGVDSARIRTSAGTVRFPTIQAWVTADVKGWISMFQTVSEEAYRNVLAEGERELTSFLDPKGDVAFPISAHLVLAEKDGKGR